MTALIEPQSDNEYQSVRSQSFLPASLLLCPCVTRRLGNGSGSMAAMSVSVICDTETPDTL